VSSRGRAGLIYGILAILVFTPLLGFVAIQTPFAQIEFSYGLAIWCTVPTSLASGVSVTVQSGGNGALALLLTVVTNMTAVVTLPFWLSAMFATRTQGTGSAKVDAIDLLQKLLVTVLVPLLVGKAVRDIVPGARGVITRNKVSLGLMNNVFLVLIAWQTISAAADDLLAQPFFPDLFVVIIAATSQHLFYLAINWLVCIYVLKLALPELKAVLIMSSAKTFPMAITTIGYLQIGRSGFLTLPCICGQISQLFIDGYLQSRWLRLLAKEENAAAAASQSLLVPTTAATADGSNSTQQHATAAVADSNNMNSTVDIESSNIGSVANVVELIQRPQVHNVQ
jgi:solute carrier family 10 (sodium/bile acid cotransporter), member 7